MRLSRSKVITASVVLPLALVLGACGSDDGDSSSTPTSDVTSVAEPSAESSEPSADASAPAAPVGDELDAAAAIARAEQEADGFAVELELDTEQGRAVWEVKVVSADGRSATELSIARDTGEILKTEPSSVGSEDPVGQGVSAQRAVEIALAEVPGRVIELDRESEPGMVVWEVVVEADAGGWTEVTIGVTSGEVVSTGPA